jgi:hypothetical protein
MCLLSAVTLCQLLMSGAAPAKQVQLEYQVTTVDDPAEFKGIFKSEDLPEAKTTTETTTVGLGGHYLSLQSAGRKTIYDLRSKRIIRINLGRSEYYEESLFADVGFRVAELQNRLRISDAMNEAKIDKSRIPYDRFQQESLFSMQLPAQDVAADPHEIKVEVSDGAMTFLRNGQWVVRVTPSKHALPEPAAGQFVRFLAIGCKIHPQIRRKIIEAGRVPEKMEYRAFNPPHAYTITMAFQKMTESDGEDLPIGKEFRLAADADGPLSDILAELKRRETPPTRGEAEAFARSALDEKKYLDAMLAAVEYQTQSGEPRLEIMTEIGPHARTDPQLRLYVEGVLSANNPQAAAAGLRGLDAIDRAGLKKGYVIDITRANALMTLKRPNEARDLFLAVLKCNPFIAGAYKDLGELYAEGFGMSLAWKCWDIGRGIYPNHPLLQEINKREQWLQERLPDFFLTGGAK